MSHIYQPVMLRALTNHSIVERVGQDCVLAAYRRFTMPRCILIIFVSIFLYVGIASAQSGEVREYVSYEHKIAITFPFGWELTPPVRNELWIAYGTLRGATAGCFVRHSTVDNLHLTKPEEYFAQTDEKAFVKLSSIAMPDIRVHLYDISFIGGRMARRVIYSGTDEGIKVANLMHQTLDGDRIITVVCFSKQNDFQLIFNELDTIHTSFRFIE